MDFHHVIIFFDALRLLAVRGGVGAQSGQSQLNKKAARVSLKIKENREFAFEHLNSLLQKRIPVLRNVTLYYRILVCTTEYPFVLRNTSLYYRVPVCTPE